MLSLKKNKEKIFCIGLNKTGTTTIKRVLSEFDYIIGDQNKGELLLHDWYNRKYKSIIKFSKSANAFQDIPFSLPYSFMFLEQYFKNAKFILTVRDNDEQWYQSLIKYHSKLWADGINPPTIKQLKNASYCYKGFAYDFNRYIFDTPENEPYHEKTLLDFYNRYNNSVKSYFKSKPDKLLIINVSNKNDYGKLCNFLNKKPLRDNFPWENKTNEK